VPEREESLASLLAALRDLVAWLQATHVSGVVIGGVAASLLGRPRVTRDVDAVVLLDESHWDAFLAAGTQFDLRQIRRWVHEFSAALDAPEILHDLNTILARRRKRKK
jgi:hypothetical protein